MLLIDVDTGILLSESLLSNDKSLPQRLGGRLFWRLGGRLLGLLLGLLDGLLDARLPGLLVFFPGVGVVLVTGRGILDPSPFSFMRLLTSASGLVLERPCLHGCPHCVFSRILVIGPLAELADLLVVYVDVE